MVRKETERRNEIGAENYIRGCEVNDVANDLRLRIKTASPIKGTGDSDGSEFYGFRGDFEENKDRRRLEIEEEEGKCRREIIRIFDGDTEEWGDAQQKYGTLKEELWQKISLDIASGHLRGRLIERGERRKICNFIKNVRKMNLVGDYRQFRRRG